jgi:putative membrane protein insertion efficiency factor
MPCATDAMLNIMDHSIKISTSCIKTIVKNIYFFLITLPKKLLILIFQGYRFILSPLFPPSCRFFPSCSQYGIEAVEKYGAIRGGAMTLWRVVRCHPFSRGGYDPVK